MRAPARREQLLDVATEGGGATALDGAHRTQLPTAE